MRIKERLYSVSGHSCVYMEKWTETYTLRQDLPNGNCIRHDGESLWQRGSTSWKGNPPKDWDESKAVRDNYTTSFEIEVDYS